MRRQYHNIALVGMMGSGKSAVGRVLAERLGWRFLDTDAEIVASQRRTISDIFDQDGEEAFRAMETEALRDAVSGAGAVIATGGGVVLRPENRDLLFERCWVVWLTATPEEHVERSAQGERRPVLERDTDRLAAVRRILMERTPLYATADALVDTSRRTVEEVAANLAALWKTL